MYMQAISSLRNKRLSSAYICEVGKMWHIEPFWNIAQKRETGFYYPHCSELRELKGSENKPADMLFYNILTAPDLC